ncbi:MAG TPA: hypothetical protein VK563_14580 [Puia sp.]|nr:hypothetical protein [Puia sp.]
MQEYISQPLWGPDLRIWYMDSFVIEEIKGISIFVDPKGIETRKLSTEFYTFIDLRSKSFYDYKTFSDTARIIKKYTQPDSVAVFGGWNFYAPHSFHITEPIGKLADTIIKNISYKRVRLVNTIESKTGPWKQITICYLLCGKKTLVRIDNQLSAKMGCPIVRYDIQPTPQDRASLSTEIEFTANTLNPEELKVFNAWEKNMKLNPVIR